jgi:poly-beta-1,6-N-acetyl-D-glucosamine synthase
MGARLLLISPVHDERPFVDGLVAGVTAQTRPPDLWIVVDDGSSDGTGERFREHAERVPFLRVVETPPRHTVGADRLAAGGPDRAWNFGLRQTEADGFTHLGKLDGDIVMEPDAVEKMLGHFAADPTLGEAGAELYEQREGRWTALGNPETHPTGACRVYSRECFEAIGGMPERLGSDAVTTTYAKLRGYRAVTLRDVGARHLRPHGSAQGALRGHARHGAYLYIVHYSFGWALARSVRVGLRERPRLLSGIWHLGGYLGAALRRAPRVQDPEFRAFVRAEERGRVRGALRRLRGQAGAGTTTGSASSSRGSISA